MILNLRNIIPLQRILSPSRSGALLKTIRPRSTFLHHLRTLGIVPEHAHDKDYGRHPIGSGPYELVRWDEGQQLIVAANSL
ncbi:MAG: ABC transporter substrate-binding protein, partial [Candidatus Electrothrix sp. AUS4]|nr:ABC transporter substrate-binding protein [Candidatus Electrothrix sp. AUS4]